MSTENCEVASANFTMPITTSAMHTKNPEDVPWLFRISFLYYSVISCIIYAAVAIPVSHYTRDPNDRSYEEMDQRMLAPFRRDENLYKKQMQQMDENSQQMTTLLTRPEGVKGQDVTGCKV